MRGDKNHNNINLAAQQELPPSTGLRGFRQRTRVLPSPLLFVFIYYFISAARASPRLTAPPLKPARAPLRSFCRLHFTSSPPADSIHNSGNRHPLPLSLCASPIHLQHDSPHPAVPAPLTHDRGHGEKNLSIWRNLKKERRKEQPPFGAKTSGPSETTARHGRRCPGSGSSALGLGQSWAVLSRC